MDSIWFSSALIVLLLVANAFFVAAEFALVKAKSFRIDGMAAEGQFGAARTAHIQKHLEPYLAACQLGITMASLGLGWVGEPAVAALLTPVLIPMGMSEAALHTTAFLVGFVLFSSLHIVLGEQVPKTFAIRRPEAISNLTAHILHAFYLLLYPLNWALNKASGGILRAFGVEEATHGDVYSTAEIRDLVDVSAEHGEITVGRAETINNLFRFDERSVERIMISRSECRLLRLDASNEENLQAIRETKHSRFPVVEGGSHDLVGILLVKDLVDAILTDDPEPWTHLRDFVRKPLIVPETFKVGELFERMREQRAHMACVMDEYGELIGIATLEDLLEEIVGEIEDETDSETHEMYINKVEDHWVAHGLASLSDVERIVGFAVEDTFAANTLSGLMMFRLNRMPEENDVVEQEGYRFTVLEMKNNHVQKIRIDRPGSIQ